MSLIKFLEKRYNVTIQIPAPIISDRKRKVIIRTGG